MTSDNGRHAPGGSSGRAGPSWLRGRRSLLAVAAAVLAVLGVGSIAYAMTQQVGAPPEAVSTGPVHTPTATASTSGPSALPRSRPTRVRVPSIDVDTADMVGLTLDTNGDLGVPVGPDPLGWYTGGPAPGSTGPAILAGHVTWNGAKGVFYRLGDVRPGDRIRVTRADHRTATFTVTATRVYPKSAFGTADVYGNVHHAALRLVTCAGDYDATHHNYADNVVVFADLTSVSRG